jgi:hypothetical protein
MREYRGTVEKNELAFLLERSLIIYIKVSVA